MLIYKDTGRVEEIYLAPELLATPDCYVPVAGGRVYPAGAAFVEGSLWYSDQGTCVVAKTGALQLAVWPDWSHDADDAAIENLVKRLRDKIEPDPRKPQYIVTLRGQGYKLTVQDRSPSLGTAYWAAGPEP